MAFDRRLHRVAELMDVGIVMLSAAKEVDFVSRRARELASLGDEHDPGWGQMVGQFEEMVDQAWVERESGRTIDLEWQAGDTCKWLSFQIYFLDEDECEGFLVVVRDRSLQRGLEADLGLAVQMRNLSRLYLGLAHDLRSPLNAIVLNLELLKRSLTEGASLAEEAGTDRRSRWLGVLEDKTRQLSQALDGLLAQTVMPTAEIASFDVGDLVQDLARLLRSQAQQQGVELEVSASGEPLTVEGRADRIKRALLNVAINGLEATPAGGTLKFSAQRQGEQVVVEISDTGPGIPKELEERIFALHFTTKCTGTGLGLYVARSALEAEGGSLQLVSSSEEGTLFRAVLPPIAEED